MHLRNIFKICNILHFNNPFRFLQSKLVQQWWFNTIKLLNSVRIHKKMRLLEKILLEYIYRTNGYITNMTCQYKFPLLQTRLNSEFWYLPSIEFFSPFFLYYSVRFIRNVLIFAVVINISKSFPWRNHLYQITNTFQTLSWKYLIIYRWWWIKKKQLCELKFILTIYLKGYTSFTCEKKLI